MYKILLVDDEQIIRDGISRNIQWEELGLELIGTCGHGVEALEKVKEVHPDIVLTDICMPFMDGIELSEEILSMHPTTKVVVLTGHDKFEYVQQAIKLKVNDFLLKPIMPRELTVILKKLVSELDYEKEKHENLKKLEEDLKHMLPLRQERFLNRLVSKPMNEKEYIEKQPMFLKYIKAHMAVAVIDLAINDKRQMTFEEQEVHLLGIKEICDSVFSQSPGLYAFERNSERVVLIFSSDSLETLEEIIALSTDKIISMNLKHQHVNVIIGVGSIVNHYKHLSISYQDAKDALDYELIDKKKSVINISDIKNTSISDRTNYKMIMQGIEGTLKTGTIEDIEGSIDSLFDELPKFCMNINDYYIHVQNYVMTLIQILDDQGVDYKSLFDKRNPFTCVFDFKDSHRLKDWLLKLCHEVNKALTNKRESYQEIQANKARDYIHEHYHENDLSLKMICKAVGMSTSYFSAIFKEMYSMTFVEYLTHHRIERAKAMMKSTDKKNYEVAEAVGFNDPHYFSLIFKKYTGMTSTEYRAKVG